MKYSRSLTCVFRPDPHRGGSRAGQRAKEKYRGTFEIQKSGDETSSGEIGLDIRTHASPKVGQDQVSGGVSVTGGPLLQTTSLSDRRLQQRTECIAVIYNHVGRSVVIFGFIRKSTF